MKPKVLFILLAVLVVCFVVGLGLGARKNKSTDLSPDWVESLGELLVPRVPLRAADIQFAQPPECETARTRGQIDLPAGENCLWFIRSSRTPVRTLHLELTRGLEAQVKLEPIGEDQLTVDQTLDSEEPQIDLQFFRKGGTLELSCRSAAGQPCRIETEE